MTQHEGGLTTRTRHERFRSTRRLAVQGWNSDREWAVGAPCLAAAVAILIVALTGLRGTDYPAHVFRGIEWRDDPLGTWNFMWYGGHSTFAYSVLAPPLTAAFSAFGLCAIASLAAVLLASKLMRQHVGPLATAAGSGTVAVMALDNVVVGRVPFALGYTLMLTTLLLWSRGRIGFAVGSALLVGFASPVAAVMLGLVVLPIAIDQTTRRGTVGRRFAAARSAITIGVAAALPLLAMSAFALHTGETKGYFPYTAIYVAYSIAAAAAVLVIARRRVVRIGAGVTLVATVLAAVVPNPLGGNLSRFTPFFIVPFGTALAVNRFVTNRQHLVRRDGGRIASGGLRRNTLKYAVVPVLWSVSVGFSLSFAVQMTTHWYRDPSRDTAYFDPLLEQIERWQVDHPLSRLEIPFTQSHIEAEVVAPTVPYARGWERQIDLARNEVLYDPNLTPTEYREWVDSMAVGLIAVPSSPLDDGGIPEAKLIDNGLPWLTLLWENQDWRLYAVDNPTPIAKGGAVTAIDGHGISFSVSSAETVSIRSVYDGRLGITPSGCLTADADGNIVAHVDAAGTYRIEEPPLSLLASDPAPCDKENGVSEDGREEGSEGRSG